MHTGYGLRHSFLSQGLLILTDEDILLADDNAFHGFTREGKKE